MKEIRMFNDECNPCGNCKSCNDNQPNRNVQAAYNQGFLAGLQKARSHIAIHNSDQIWKNPDCFIILISELTIMLSKLEDEAANE